GDDVGAACGIADEGLRRGADIGVAAEQLDAGIAREIVDRIAGNRAGNDAGSGGGAAVFLEADADTLRRRRAGAAGEGVVVDAQVRDGTGLIVDVDTVI